MIPTNEAYISQVIRQRFPELDESQFERVKEMAIAFSEKNQGRLPSIDGYVNLVKSQPERLTPFTKEEESDKRVTGGQFVGPEGARIELFQSAHYTASQPGCGLKASALADFNDRVVVGKEGFTKSIVKSLGSAASFWLKK